MIEEVRPLGSTNQNMSIDDFASPTLVGDPRLGAVLQNRYRIVEKLSEGGMGAVYLAEHLMIKRKVAIKFLHSHFASNPAVAKRFHREALAATAVGNEHIVDVLDMGYFDDGSLFMVLEFLQGRDFGQEIRLNGPQPLPRVVHIICQICDALTEVHSKGIVHRDMKPGNIFLIRRGDDPDFVKILDFGISKFKTCLEGKDARVTATGATIGTPHFMSPEQAEDGSRIDHRTDIYALGSMMYYALTETFPFEGTSLPALIMNIFTSQPRSVCELRPDLPPDIAAIISRLMTKEQDRRYQDCADLKQALMPFRASGTMSSIPPEVVTEPEPVAGNGEVSDRVSLSESNLESDSAVVQRASKTPERTSENVWDFRTVEGSKRAFKQPVTTDLSVEIPKRSVRTPLAVGVLLTMVAAIGLLIAYSVNSNDKVVEKDESQTPSKAASSESSRLNITADKDPKTVPIKNIKVRIRAIPTKAELFLDRSPITNPFDGELPESGSVHALHARLEGYQSVSQELVLRYPQAITLQLKPKIPKTPHSKKREKRLDSKTGSEKSVSNDSQTEGQEIVSTNRVKPPESHTSSSPKPVELTTSASKERQELKQLF